MPTNYTVQHGDCISSIAFGHGIFPDTIWNDPANATLKELRVNGNVLAPGDVVVIPDQQAKSVPCATGALHRFRRRGVPEKLRVALHAFSAARAELPYALVIGETRFEGKTDADGCLEQFIPPDAASATLIISDTESYELALGELNPPKEDETEGVPDE